MTATVEPPPEHDEAEATAPPDTISEPAVDPRSDRERTLALGSTAAALAVATATSVWQLGRRPLWIDEAISLGATNQLGETVRGTGGTMALYYALLTPWTAVVGTSPVALRLLSLLLVLVGLVVAAAVLRRLLDPVTAAVAIVITAALPGTVRMAQDARSYALVALLAACCWLCTARTVEAHHDPDRQDEATRWSLALVPLAVAGVAAQGLFALHLLALAASVLVVPRRWRLLARLGPGLLAGAAATVGLLAIGAGDVGDWIPPLSWEQTGAVWRSLLGPTGWVAILLAALAALGVISTLRHLPDAPVDRWKALAPLAWAFVPLSALLVLSTVRPTFLGRYVLASGPGLASLIAVGVATTWRQLRPTTSGGRARDGAPVVVRIAVVAALLVGLVVTRIERTDIGYEDWDAVVAHVAAQAQPGDGIVFPHATDQAHQDTARAPFEAAWAQIDEPTVVPVALDPARPLGEVRRFDDLTPPAQLAEDLVAHPRVWAVEFPGFHPSLRSLMAREPAASRFRTVERTTFPGGMVVLLMVQVPT